MALSVLGPADFDQVRALLLPTQTALVATSILTDTTLSMAAIGGRVEALVKQRLGADWPGFVATPPVIPASYAQGDSDLAVQLLHDALVQFTCAQVVRTGIMQQLTPVLQKLPNVTVETQVPWPVIQANFEQAGYAALNLLRRAVPVPCRTFASPSAGAAGQLASGICTEDGPGWGRRGRW